MTSNTTPRNQKIVLAICGMVVFFSLLTAGIALYDRFAQTNQRREQQLQFNQATRDTFVDLLCFVRFFHDGSPPTKAQDQASEDFIRGALKSIKAPIDSCSTPPHAP